MKGEDDGGLMYWNAGEFDCAHFEHVFIERREGSEESKEEGEGKGERLGGQQIAMAAE
jgi:hypothetical protein